MRRCGSAAEGGQVRPNSAASVRWDGRAELRGVNRAVQRVCIEIGDEAGGSERNLNVSKAFRESTRTITGRMR